MRLSSCLLCTLFLFSSFIVRAQYKDLVLHNGQLWCLSKNGTITVFDLGAEKKIIIEIPYSSNNAVLTRDAKNRIAAGTNSGEIKVFDSTSWSWQNIAKVNEKILGLVFNNSNKGYAITPKGIVDLETRRHYFPDSSLNHQIHYKGNWFRDPSYLMDKHENIWVGFGYGEWGGDLFIFDTRAKKFIVPQLNRFEITLFPVKSFFEDGQQVYASCGLAHFFTSGCIVQFDNYKCSYVFLSETKREKVNDTGKDSLIIGEYIGPAAFSKRENSIYFYSQNGIFKGDVRKDLSKLEHWTKVFQPKLKWKSGQPDAIGSPMNVLELKITDDGKIIFSSQSDGIGIYKNNNLKMIK